MDNIELKEGAPASSIIYWGYNKTIAQDLFESLKARKASKSSWPRSFLPHIKDYEMTVEDVKIVEEYEVETGKTLYKVKLVGTVVAKRT